MDISKLPGWLLAIAMVVIAASFGYVAIKQPPHFEFASFGFGSRQQVEMSLDSAVIAFDSKCPAGWNDVGLKEAERFAGRTLIATGPRVDRANNETTLVTAFNAQGGEEQHTLTPAEMPKHFHWLPTVNEQFGQGTRINGIPFNAYGWFLGKGGMHQRLTDEQGENDPHNNMPPYIALYFCKKEG